MDELIEAFLNEALEFTHRPVDLTDLLIDTKKPVSENRFFCLMAVREG
jgi:hypothetical protein